MRGAGGSGGNSTSTGAAPVPRGHSQSMIFRLTKNETTITAIAGRIVLSRIACRIVPPDWFRDGESTLITPSRAKCRDNNDWKQKMARRIAPF